MTTPYTDDDNPTVIAIRAIQAEAVAKERARIREELQHLERLRVHEDPYTKGWNDALDYTDLLLDLAAQHANGDR